MTVSGATFFKVPVNQCHDTPCIQANVVHLCLLVFAKLYVGLVYFHPLNSYSGASEFLGALDGTRTTGLLASMAYSTLAAVGLGIAFVTLESYGAKYLS